MKRFHPVRVGFEPVAHFARGRRSRPDPAAPSCSLPLRQEPPCGGGGRGGSEVEIVTLSKLASPNARNGNDDTDARWACRHLQGVCSRASARSKSAHSRLRTLHRIRRPLPKRQRPPRAANSKPRRARRCSPRSWPRPVQARPRRCRGGTRCVVAANVGCDSLVSERTAPAIGSRTRSKLSSHEPDSARGEFLHGKGHGRRLRTMFRAGRPGAGHARLNGNDGSEPRRSPARISLEGIVVEELPTP